MATKRSRKPKSLISKRVKYVRWESNGVRFTKNNFTNKVTKRRKR